MLKNSYALTPVKDLSFDEKTNLFHSSGVDPIFTINLKNKKLRAGWYWISIKISLKKGLFLSPKLYFDYGRGYNEEDSWPLNRPTDGIIEGLVKFPFDILHLRFDPSIADCSFELNYLQLTPISKVRAFSYALKNYRKINNLKNSYASIISQLLKTFVKAGVLEVKGKMKDAVTIKQEETYSEYYQWFKHYDNILEEDKIAMQHLIKGFRHNPLLSIVMPVYNAPVYFLRKAIDSVLEQVYPNWELCIADDCSTLPEVKKTLSEYAKKDKRIKVTYRTQNGHISEASNSAIAISTGDFMVLLDQDDELRPHSLFMIADALNKNKNLALIYSDEDKIDENGLRYDPYFKSDWNPDLFSGQNMINHLAAYKMSIIKEIGGFRKGYEGSQDYDLALRFIERIETRQIHHISHILYHWRAIPGSTATETASKGYAYKAGLKALQDHIARTNTNAVAEENINFSYRIRRQLPEKKPLVSIIIPTKDKIDILNTCLQSILSKTSYPNYEIIIIDNNSETEAAHYYFKKMQEQTRSIKVYNYNKEFNFAAIMNYGVNLANGEVVVLLNNDTEVINDDWLTEMTSHTLRKECGAVGAKLYYPDNCIQHAGVFVCEGHPGIHVFCRQNRNEPGYFNRLHLVQNYIAVTAACLAVRKNLYLKAGGLDEANLKVAYNDVDFCLKLHDMGYQNVWTPFAELYHYESLSRGSDFDEKNIERFKREHSYMLKKWDRLIKKDPYFNLNLSSDTYKIKFSYPPKVLYPWH
ncbi:glycosyltransferase family 2 protein [Lacibacter sp. H375]|uniref:glycosyltransferase family 2 protein n=1 Tax=Lacibacter sp. H375 TaxID=3133424 RepID=UPI0030C11ECC